MNLNAFAGKKVRLAVLDPEHDAQALARWDQNSTFQQLANSGPIHLTSSKQIQEWLENHAGQMFQFGIRALDEDRLIGSLDLNGIDWVTGNAWIGIGIGEPADWGKGYGTEAMRLALRYAFEMLNLRRVSLTVFAYNQRAYRAYCKAGFREEGRLRQWLQRGGERYDLIFMGILRCEWEECPMTEPLEQK